MVRLIIGMIQIIEMLFRVSEIIIKDKRPKST